MLDQLIESRSHGKENKKLSEYLLTTSVLAACLLSSAFLYNLFAQNLELGREGFELSTIVAPIEVEENVPPEVLPKEQPRRESSQTKSAMIARQTNTLRIEESPIALDKVSVAPNTQKARPNGSFLVSDKVAESSSSSFSAGEKGERGEGSGIGISGNQAAQVETIAKTIPPPPQPPTIKKTIVEPIEKKKTAISKGVINGQAMSLPKPPYPPTARAVNASGVVNVQVTIDETGKVISAKAVDGHPLLRPAAEKAAWTAKFKPTLLSNEPVKVTGVIVYKFATQ